MPSYEFTCRECGAAFEVRLSMSDYARGEGRVCPSCGSTQVERAFTVVNVIAGTHTGGGSLRSGGGCGPSGFT